MAKLSLKIRLGGGGVTVGARKVEQICNGVFHGDVWNGNAQSPPPTAICVSVQGKICQSAACWASLQLGSALIFKPGCTFLACITEANGYTDDGRGLWGGELNLKSDLQSSLCGLKGLSAGKVWCWCFKTETKRRLNGGRVVGGVGWCLPAWSAFILASMASTSKQPLCAEKDGLSVSVSWDQ